MSALMLTLPRAGMEIWEAMYVSLVPPSPVRRRILRERCGLGESTKISG